jgi:hypothetical protein
MLLSQHWRWAVRLYCETKFPQFTGGLSSAIRSVQGSFEDQMNDRALLGRPALPNYPSRAQVERHVRTLVLNPTRPTPRFEEPEVSFLANSTNREVQAGLRATSEYRVILLAYGWDCELGRAVFGPWGNVAHFTTAARQAFAEARRRSHRRQRELQAWLDDLALRARHGDDDATAEARRIAKGCDGLLERTSGEFMRGVHARRAA